MVAGYGNATNAYKNNSVNYASKEQLLLMIVDGAVKFTKRAIVAVEEKDIEKAHENIVKVQSIVYELIASLDVDQAGDWGRGLLSIYEFIVVRLTEANIKKDKKILEDILPLIEEINDTWKQAYTISKK